MQGEAGEAGAGGAGREGRGKGFRKAGGGGHITVVLGHARVEERLGRGKKTKFIHVII